MAQRDLSGSQNVWGSYCWVTKQAKKNVHCDDIIVSSDSLFCVNKTGNLRNISNTVVLLTCDQETFQSCTRIHRCFDG